MLCKSVNLCNEKLLFLQSEDGIQMDVVLTILMIPKGYLHMPKAYITLRKQYITFPEEIYHFPVRENPFSQCPFRCGFLNAVMQGGSLPPPQTDEKADCRDCPDSVCRGDYQSSGGKILRVRRKLRRKHNDSSRAHTVRSYNRNRYFKGSVWNISLVMA